MTQPDPQQETMISKAVAVLRAGGVIAYPTEHCFGLGCDPNNFKAIEKLLEIKNRKRDQGIILIAADLGQISEWVDISGSPLRTEILASWPGPNTWVLPALEHVSDWVRGTHTSVAMRIPAHELCLKICQQFGGAIVSTSANRHGSDALLNAKDVEAELGAELDYIVDAPVGGAQSASTIRRGDTGEQLR